jgi:hypothetical protein
MSGPKTGWFSAGFSLMELQLKAEEKVKVVKLLTLCY